MQRLPPFLRRRVLRDVGTENKCGQVAQIVREQYVDPIKRGNRSCRFFHLITGRSPTGRFLRHRHKRSERRLHYGNCTKASERCQRAKVCRRPSVKTMLAGTGRKSETKPENYPMIQQIRAAIPNAIPTTSCRIPVHPIPRRNFASSCNSGIESRSSSNGMNIRMNNSLLREK